MAQAAAGRQFRITGSTKFSSMCHGFSLTRNTSTGNDIKPFRKSEPVLAWVPAPYATPFPAGSGSGQAEVFGKGGVDIPYKAANVSNCHHEQGVVVTQCHPGDASGLPAPARFPIHMSKIRYACADRFIAWQVGGIQSYGGFAASK